MSEVKQKPVLWFARITVLLTFIINLQCAFLFLFFPEQYVGAYELSGVAGRVAIQGLAVAFLMWNATYPLVIINPYKYRTLYMVVLVQQLIGLVGESALFLNIPNGFPTLSASIFRFIAFDAGGFILMMLGFIALGYTTKKGMPKHPLV